MEIRNRGLDRIDCVVVTAISFMVWLDTLVLLKEITPKQAKLISKPVRREMKKTEGDFKLFDIRVLLDLGYKGQEWTPAQNENWHHLIQLCADDLKVSKANDFYVRA